MKLRIRDKSEKAEPVLDVWLEQDAKGNIQLWAESGGYTRIVAVLSENGIELGHNFYVFGLPTDAAGRVKVIE